MREWEDPRHELLYDLDIPYFEVTVKDNPIVHVLLGPDGKIIRQWRERRPPGFNT